MQSVREPLLDYNASRDEAKVTVSYLTEHKFP